MCVCTFRSERMCIHTYNRSHRRNVRGVPVPPTFWTEGIVPPLFRTQVKHLLSSEAISGDQITLKPFSSVAPPRTPSPESSSLKCRFSSIGEVCGRACRAKPQTLTRLYFFLLTCATIWIYFLALFGAAKPWNYYFDIFHNFHNYPYRQPNED